MRFLLLVGLFMLAGCTDEAPGETPDAGENAAPEAPTTSWVKDTAAGTITVAKIESAEPVSWQDLQVNGCDKPSSGDVEAGDVMTNCAGDVKITHTPSQTLLWKTTF